MMPLESQVCSLELAKRLKELGVKQESLFYWVAEDIYDRPYNRGKYILVAREQEYYVSSARDNHISSYPGLSCDECPHSWNPVEIYSAFTVAELGEMLQQDIHDCQLIISFSGNEKLGVWCCGYQGLDVSCYSELEAECRAKMLIYLLENGLVKNE